MKFANCFCFLLLVISFALLVTGKKSSKMSHSEEDAIAYEESRRAKEHQRIANQPRG
uniref:Putative 4.2 kDa basic salivary protein n=1 Tax=Culex tarsalis TaxID=7177 RepID=B8RIW6_CULTA